MGALLQISLTFPTVLFSTGLAILLGYWLLVLLGALGLDALGSGDADADVDAELDVGEASGGIGFFGLWRLRRIPMTLALTLVMLLGWASSCIATQYLAEPLLGLLPAMLVRLVILLVALAVALPLASLLATPLAPLFHAHEAPRRASFIGRTVEIETARVDGKFGQARLKDGGAGLILQVRHHAGNRLTRGSRAMLISHDDAQGAYEVEPLDEILGEPTRSERSEN